MNEKSLPIPLKIAAQSFGLTTTLATELAIKNATIPLHSTSKNIARGIAAMSGAVQWLAPNMVQSTRIERAQKRGDLEKNLDPRPLQSAVLDVLAFAGAVVLSQHVHIPDTHIGVVDLLKNITTFYTEKALVNLPSTTVGYTLRRLQKKN